MRKKVLIIEDEMIVAMDLQVILTDLGYDVSGILTTGEAAVQQAAALNPDLVLMDIHLSDQMDGIEAASIIKDTLAIPVVYLTAYADDETIAKVSRTTPFGYILKPYEPREIKANLEIAFYKHRLDQEVQESRQWLLAVLSSISEAVIACDATGKIRFMNPVAEALTGWPQEQATDRRATEIFTLINALTRAPMENPLEQALQTKQEVVLPDDTLLCSRDRTEIPIADSTSPILDRHKQTVGAVMVFRDVTEQKQVQATLQYNALHDPLTSLPNRVLFLDRLQQAIERQERSLSFGFAVMLLDLDRFKVINDTLGHLLGDRLLIAVAPRFKTHLRAFDTVARFGGDEFAILLEDVNDPAIACRMAERILAELRKPFQVDGHALLVTASIGIVLSSIPYNQASDLLKDADIAMYRAKARGRNGYEIFDAEMHQQARMVLQMEQDLRQAITYQQFQVHYQPIVSLTTHQVISLECLVRWRNTSGTLVSPHRFIPVAEEAGIVAEIDQFVLRQSCRQLKRWQEQFGDRSWHLSREGSLQLADNTELTLPPSLSVNLSSQQFAQARMLNTITQILQETKIAGDRLKLEITESIFINNAEAAAQILSQLKNLGCQIHLDDFGTGYSALSYLHKFPIDGVKIDRSFIQDMTRDREKLEIVRAILGLCAALNTEVTAEGIETAEQARVLTELGCTYGQGYFFGSAIPGQVLTTHLENGMDAPEQN